MGEIIMNFTLYSLIKTYVNQTESNAKTFATEEATAVYNAVIALTTAEVESIINSVAESQA